MNSSVQQRYGQPRGIFSQLDEDIVLQRYFVEAKLANGKFLDIGAYDGVLYSNTRVFAMQGWSGVCVEASQMCFDQLRKTYPLTDDRIMCVRAAVTLDTDGEIELFESSDPVSTTVQFNRDKFCGLSQFSPVKVPAMSVARLAKQFPGPYHLISIDTEGTSVEIALALPPEMVVAGSVLCVEYDLELDRLVDGLKDRGFSLSYENGLNALFVKD